MLAIHRRSFITPLYIEFRVKSLRSSFFFTDLIGLPLLVLCVCLPGVSRFCVSIVFAQLILGSNLVPLIKQGQSNSTLMQFSLKQSSFLLLTRRSFLWSTAVLISIQNYLTPKLKKIKKKKGNPLLESLP